MSASIQAKQVEITSLDRLISMEPTSDDLRYRARFWLKYVETTNLPSDEACRIIGNCSALLRAADRMDDPAPVVTLATSKPARTTSKPRTVGAEEFWTLQSQAVRAIEAKYGRHWKILAPAETFECTLPAKLCSYTGPLGGKIKWRRDHRMPIAAYWPGGVLPVGCEPCDPGKPIDEWATGGIMERAYLARAEQIAVNAKWRRDQAEAKRGFDPKYPKMEA